MAEEAVMNAPPWTVTRLSQCHDVMALCCSRFHIIHVNGPTEPRKEAGTIVADS
jgi:hypothetical protein